jgi:hypothetical protein
MAKNNAPGGVERDRETRLVRAVPCDVCDAPAGKLCRPGLWMLDDSTGPIVQRMIGYWSHAGRYDRAAAAGLVPAMAGGTS